MFHSVMRKPGDTESREEGPERDRDRMVAVLKSWQKQCIVMCYYVYRNIL